MSSVEPGQFIIASGYERDAVAWLNERFEDAIRDGVSDMHFESTEAGGAILRVRIDGLLQEVATLPSQLANVVDAKIRHKARLSVSERASALDGRLFFETRDGLRADVRVSILPAHNGQSIVCRLLYQSHTEWRLDQIGLPLLARQAIQELIERPDGLLLLTGPTGSGKTTTIYSVLRELNQPHRKIITIEDPIEYRMEGITQVGVTPAVTFAGALRATLRQDPDVILVGEIRDAETARIAIQASVTGHLVLTTLHATDAATTLTRLQDLGVDPYTLGLCLRGVLAQRLVRRCCACGCEDGCETCRFTGYRGRLPLVEMIVGTDRIRKALVSRDLGGIRRAAAHQTQYQNLLSAGHRLVQQGLTTAREVARVTSNEGFVHDESPPVLPAWSSAGRDTTLGGLPGSGVPVSGTAIETGP